MRGLLVSLSIVALIVAGMLFSFNQYRRDRALKSDEIAKCVGSHTGDDERDEDWVWLATFPTDQILRRAKIDSPHPENVINNCLHRPITGE